MGSEYACSDGIRPLGILARMTSPTVDRAGDVPALLAGAVATGPAGALLTFYDDATGERCELPAEVLGGWAARTANLLIDGCGLGQGGRAAVLLPPHWQTAAVLFGSWAAGLSVDYRSWATAGLPLIGTGSAGRFDVAFVASDRQRSMLEDPPEAAHRFVLELGPRPAARPAPDGFRDFLGEARRHPGEFRAPVLLRDADPASVDGTSYAQWGLLAQETAVALGIRPGDRVLVDAAAHDHPVTWLLAPLAAGASVVLCANLDPSKVAARTAAERVTRML
jgi:uncharacterized protein (TIGR03089 family)